jgi:hypothetical protein
MYRRGERTYHRPRITTRLSSKVQITTNKVGSGISADTVAPSFGASVKRFGSYIFDGAARLAIFVSGENIYRYQQHYQYNSYYHDFHKTCQLSYF